MDLSNIKLIVSDMDGTLLNSQEEPSNLFFEQFQQLQKLGVHFVAASGRQHDSIAHKLSPIKNDITIAGENGGVVKRNGQVLLLQTIDPKKIINIIPTLRNIDDIFIILCGEHKAFIESTDPKLIDMFQEYYGTHEIVEDLTNVPLHTPILKIALYHPESSEQFIYPQIQKVENDFLLKISGKNWLDISTPISNKGAALRFLQKKMNITSEETLVFGDYLNDLEMLNAAYFSYAMKNAHPDIIEAANFMTASNDDLGVEKIISEVIQLKSRKVL